MPEREATLFVSQMPRSKNDHLQALRREWQTVGGRTVGKYKECNGTGRYRCDVCGGADEIDAREPKAA